jgi:hypothetical protein
VLNWIGNDQEQRADIGAGFYFCCTKIDEIHFAATLDRTTKKYIVLNGRMLSMKAARSWCETLYRALVNRIFENEIQEFRAALLAAYKWRGLDGDGISQPELGQIERALGLEESK